MARAARPQPSSDPAEERLTRFVEQVRNQSPFNSQMVVRPAEMEVDAGGVHDKEFKRLEGLARRARMQTSGIGVVLWGAAGVGKSHLIARFARVADPACFVYLNNIQANSDRIPFYVLKCVISYLTGGQARQLHQTALFKLVHEAVQDALRQDGATSSSWSQAEVAFDKYVDRIGARDPASAVLIDRSVFAVLFRFYRSASISQHSGKEDGLARLAVQWLSGEQIDAEKALRLGLAVDAQQEEPVGLTDEQQVKQVFYALTQIAVSRAQPFVLCFDQVDNARADAVSSLSRFLHDMIDNIGNLLVITSGVRHTLYEWMRNHVITQASWDRIAQHEIMLTSITTEEGRQILEARLSRFLLPFSKTKEILQRTQQDRLFPLGTPWFTLRYAKLVEVRPRDIILHARERWHELQEGLAAGGVQTWLDQWTQSKDESQRVPADPKEQERAVDAAIGQKILELKDRRLREPHTLPPDGDNLAGLIHTLLVQCLDGKQQYTLVEALRLPPPKYGIRPLYDLIVRERRQQDGKEVTTKLLFITTQSATSVARTLGKVVEDKTPPDHILLVTDQRQALPKGAKGEERLKQLLQQGASRFRHIELSFEEYAALDALHGVVGLAVSADLEVELPGRPALTLTEKDVVESHHRQNRYMADALLRELLTEEEVAVPAPAVTKPPIPAPPPPEPVATGPTALTPLPPKRRGRPPKDKTPIAPPGASVETAKPPPVGTAVGPPGRVNDQDARMFIRVQLALNMGVSTSELAHRYVSHLRQTNQPVLYVHYCKEGLETIARLMDAEGLIKATPHKDGLFLLSM